MEKRKALGKELQEKLFYKPKHIADIKDDAWRKKCDAFCEDYKVFLGKVKTERIFVKTAVEMLNKKGYKPFKPGTTYKTGDKIYYINRNKALIAATIGKKSVEEGVRIAASHIDVPRLDIKPNPLYEDSEFAYFKTHYYGGIKKYQWAAIPLSLHGVVVVDGDKTIDISIGEGENDPVFYITDLLPHLGKDQAKRELSEGIKGEELNILCGSLPFDDVEISDRVKLNTMRLINEKYGITEKDFLAGELEIVPAFMPKDVGFDRALIGAYGHDDRVCAYTSLMAEMDAVAPTYTTVTVFADKEEIGSDGNTGLNSDYLEHFIMYLADAFGVDFKTVLRNSQCLSADVNAAFDPTFPEVLDKRNAAFANKGVVITKYTGAGGKYETSDAGAEFLGFVTNLLDKQNVSWQIGELGRVDQGGGGTVAKYIASKNIDVVDIGVPIISMHAPFEVAAKYDIYSAFEAFTAFYK